MDLWFIFSAIGAIGFLIVNIMVKSFTLSLASILCALYVALNLPHVSDTPNTYLLWFAGVLFVLSNVGLMLKSERI